MNFRFYVLPALLGLLSLSMPAAAPKLPKTGLAGSLHDIGAAGCRSCHAPHSGSAASGATGMILLWSRSFPATANTFGVYDSNSLQNKAVDLGGIALTTSTDSRMYSLLCLSCHDGVTSTFSPAMQNKNRVGSRTTWGGIESYGLSNDHPVNMSHNPILNPSLQPVATVEAVLPLYGSNKTVQCGTCHDSHSNVNFKFLRQANTTAHCTTCHL